MNLSALLAIVSFALWIVFTFVLATPAGWPNLFYAAAVILIARRIMIGAPKFLA
jgi:hypothetical protein